MLAVIALAMASKEGKVDTIQDGQKALAMIEVKTLPPFPVLQFYKSMVSVLVMIVSILLATEDMKKESVILLGCVLVHLLREYFVGGFD